MHSPRQELAHLPHSEAISNQESPAQARLASIVESSEDAVITNDLDGTILTWNRGASAIYGYTAEEAIGSSVELLISPDLRDEQEQWLANIRAGERIHHVETTLAKKNGLPIHVSLTLSPIVESGRVVAVSHIARDISEQKRLEAANSRLASIVESSEDAILSKDLDGTIETWNSSAERIYGYSANEAIGQNISFLLPAERANEEQEILSNLRRGGRVEHFETTRLRKDGQLIEVSLSISPIRDAGGAISGASHIARDITERKSFEQQMRQMQRLESLGVLAGGIAHDFNNLLTGIIGNASLIADMLPISPIAREHLQDLMLAAQRAADLTGQLLAYSGGGQFVVAPVNISDLISEISTLVKASIPKNVSVRLELEKHLPTIEADHSQMQQLAMNMIINGAEAIEANRPGTVIVRTGAQQLDENYIRAAFPAVELTPGEYVYIEVRDDGCGMDDATKARIFDPFFTTKFTGRGLGLAAALGIVNAHKGAIRVTSAPGEGSVFKVYFPASD